MCRSILDLLSNEKRGRLSSLVAEQADGLAEIECVYPPIGHWIDEFEMPFLLEILSSTGDKEFAHEFPHVGLSATDRLTLMDAIINHAAECPHCQLKMKYDSELESAIHGRTEHETEYASAGA